MPEETTLTHDRDSTVTPTLRAAVGYCTIVFAVSRIGLSLLGLTVGSISEGLMPRQQPGVSASLVGVHNLWDGLDRFDAQWFTLLATKGYGAHPSSAAFFPLYPLSIRALDAIPGVGSLGAATIVSNLSFLGALILLYRLTERELSTAMARRTIVLLACFPTAFFFIAPYSESLFLLLTVAAFAMMRRDRWASGAVAGCAAAATRLIGIALIPSFIVEAWTRPEKGSRDKRVAWTLVIALGPALYLGWWWWHGGDPLAPLLVQQEWERTLAFPITTLGRGLAQAIGGFARPDGGYWISDFTLTAIVIAGVVTMGRRIAPSYIVYAAFSLLVPLCYPFLGRDLLSMSRFVLVIFPGFWGVAHWCRRRWVFVAWVSVSTSLLVWHAMLFMHWRPIL